MPGHHALLNHAKLLIVMVSKQFAAHKLFENDK